jgi:CubicO group peptidase (beta-lactamase class C family)
MKEYESYKILTIVVLFFLCMNLFIPFSTTAKQDQKYTQKDVFTDDFDQSMITFMNNSHWPSLAVAIIKNDSMVWSKSYGYADIKNKRLATNATVYMLASISKTFTATALMQLWEKGFFNLDDDIDNYLPFTVRNPSYPDVPITFRMLLTHRSSIASRTISLFTLFSIFRLPYSYLGEYLTPGKFLYSPKNWENFPPGQDQYYSCTAYELLGYLVECLSHQTLPEYCTKNILQPLDMKNSSYYPSDFTREQLATQYMYIGGAYISLPEFEDRNYASGGLRSTVEDLSHYLIAYMNGGQYQGVRILKNDTVKTMFTLQYPTDSYIGYGLGWQIYMNQNDSENNLRIGHNGGMPGSQTYMFYHVFEHAGIIIFTNQHFVYSWNDMSSWFSVINLLTEKAKTIE